MRRNDCLGSFDVEATGGAINLRDAICQASIGIECVLPVDTDICISHLDTAGKVVPVSAVLVLSTTCSRTIFREARYVNDVVTRRSTSWDNLRIFTRASGIMHGNRANFLAKLACQASCNARHRVYLSTVSDPGLKRTVDVQRSGRFVCIKFKTHRLFGTPARSTRITMCGDGRFTRCIGY